MEWVHKVVALDLEKCDRVTTICYNDDEGNSCTRVITKKDDGTYSDIVYKENKECPAST